MQRLRGQIPCKLIIKMIVKTHTDNGRLVLAVCDEDLSKKKIEEGNKILDLTSNFYLGDKKTDLELKDLIDQAYMINAVGRKTIDFLIKEKLISPEELFYVGKVPFITILFEGRR
jgi:hypothetical protein